MLFYQKERCYSSEILCASKTDQTPTSYRNILHIIQGEMGLFLTFTVLELQRDYLYQNGVEFQQKVIGASLNLSSLLFTAPQGIHGPFPHCWSREQVPSTGMRHILLIFFLVQNVFKIMLKILLGYYLLMNRRFFFIHFYGFYY